MRVRRFVMLFALVGLIAAALAASPSGRPRLRIKRGYCPAAQNIYL